MLGKFSIIATIAATLMIPASLSAQPASYGAPPAGGGGGGGGPGAGPGGGGGGPAAGAKRGYVNRNVTINRNVYVNRGGPIVGRRYHGGVWYGTGRHFWHGRWYAYGAGPCWLASPVGYVWVCG